MTDALHARARCEAHGLVYDPGVHSGCVVCRRGTEDSVPPDPEPVGMRAIKIKIAIAAAVLVLANVVLFTLALDRLRPP